MRTHRRECRTATAAAPDFIDITEQVQGALTDSGISDGQVTVFSPQEACTLLVQERESGLLADIEQTLRRIGARSAGSRCPLVGSPSVVLPAVEGRLRLGVWQRVMLVELSQPRTRSVVVQITGE
jgi:secondary thiamine-phosphate synthase enzyme